MFVGERVVCPTSLLLRNALVITHPLDQTHTTTNEAARVLWTKFCHQQCSGITNWYDIFRSKKNNKEDPKDQQISQVSSNSPGCAVLRHGQHRRPESGVEVSRSEGQKPLVGTTKPPRLIRVAMWFFWMSCRLNYDLWTVGTSLRSAIFCKHMLVPGMTVQPCNWLGIANQTGHLNNPSEGTIGRPPPNCG